MEHKIKLTEFINGLTLSSFHFELLQSSFSSIVSSVSADLVAVKISLSRHLTETESSELAVIVATHVKVIVTELEIRLKAIDRSSDYLAERNDLKSLISDFNILNDREKALVAKYCLVDDTTAVVYYMGLGLSQAEATMQHLVYRAEDINKAAVVCRSRAESSIIKYISIKYLEESNAATFIAAIRDFITDYGSIAHLGMNYGQSREGIMDYVESTNAYEGDGLSIYTFRDSYTFADCRDELKNYLVYGIKPQEFDLLN